MTDNMGCSDDSVKLLANHGLSLQMACPTKKPDYFAGPSFRAIKTISQNGCSSEAKPKDRAARV